MHRLSPQNPTDFASHPAIANGGALTTATPALSFRLKRLKLTGFKSFVEPAELRIEPGLTGVVGPNGCGKSNLLEAIRWVMGENSPKSLRSGGMDAVIFAGTASRPARDFAEVVLNAETADHDELEVVRRIERGAGSAYRINGSDARARDVALIFADAATGAHSPALVGQGRIAAVIAARPAERRQMLEEAAGIAGLNVRRRDAEQKLCATEANLARLDDLIAGLDAQITALHRQARAAERYTALSTRIRLAEARLVYARWRDAAVAAALAQTEAEAAERAVATAQDQAKNAAIAQAAASAVIAEARETLADRRDDASAAGHRLATLTSQLDSAEQRLRELDRMARRLDEDRGDADRLTSDSAAALARLQTELAQGQALLADKEARRPALAIALERAEAASSAAELALAQATAVQSGVEAEWRVADFAVAAAQARLDRLQGERSRHEANRAILTANGDGEGAAAEAKQRLFAATAAVASARSAVDRVQSAKTDLQSAADTAASALAGVKAELAGIEREYQALLRDREQRAKQAHPRHGLPLALDRLRAEPGYERALAAVLGRDAKSPLGTATADEDGRFWTGAEPRTAVTDSLAHHVTTCPPELAARLALVHVADHDDGRPLAPGEWLVTRAGRLRRWDGLVARGEGAAEAVRLEADTRFAALAAELPQRRAAADSAAAEQARVRSALAEAITTASAAESALSAAAEVERSALRTLDQAEAARDRLALRRAELDVAAADLAGQCHQGEAERNTTLARRASLPALNAGRALLAAAKARHEEARRTLQAATAGLAAQDQALAVGQERIAAQIDAMRGWDARARDAAHRLVEMGRRLEEIVEERAGVAAKLAALMREIEDGEAVRDRLAGELGEAEAWVGHAEEAARLAGNTLATVQEALAEAREARAGAAARADNEDQRRAEMARLSGERFQCPPPLLPEKWGFAAGDSASASDEAAEMERLTAERERIGPVNLIAAEELAASQARQGDTRREQAELTEAVNRLRGSIGSLNREGRERLRTAFEAVDGHFRRLFQRLFEGGQAQLALIDSDDPLEAGLEILAQPPGKRLQSLTLLSGGEQALTAIALIFALFLTNPAPICVLDEVDAPLDDANVERFCDLLDAMVAVTDTGYLIVTHNAVSMSRMHRLFGVTMVERGVSRLVSVDLGGAEALLAAE